MRDKKRAIDKFVTLNVQQISATLEQVRLKAGALAGFVGAQHGAQRTYALLTLANKLISQCEVQVRGGLGGALQEGWVGWVAQPWGGGVGCRSCMRLGAAPTHPHCCEYLLGRPACCVTAQCFNEWPVDHMLLPAMPLTSPPHRTMPCHPHPRRSPACTPLPSPLLRWRWR